MNSQNIKHAADLIGRAFDISILLDYQDDAIVSREIIKKDTGTVTLFVFDKGQGLSEHTAPFDAAIYVLVGKARVFISGKAQMVNKGQMIIMPANKPYSLKAFNRSRCS